MNKKYRIIVGVNLFFMLALTGCGAQNAAAPTASSVAEKTVETVAVDPTGQPENKEVVCEAQQRDYTLQVIRENGKKITDELSSYHDLYEGSYTVEVKKGDDICEDYKLVFDKDKTLYFPEPFELNFFDINEDGQTDFSLGQKIGSSAMEYHFYTITTQGKIQEITGSGKPVVIVTDGREGYFPEFHVQNKTLVYHAYDQDLEKTVEKKKKFE